MKNKKIVACMLCATTMAATLGGCGTKSANDSKPSINIESYTKVGYDTTTVQSGDIAPVLELSLSPDEFETKSYKIEQSDYEVEKINVAEGDRVEADQVMVEFKADEIQKTIDEYTEEKEENEMLIEHYQKLQQIDGEDYSSDIESLKEDISIADTYIEEQNEKKKDYSLIAEKAGTVTYVNEWLSYGYVNANEVLVTVASGSSNYTATTDDSYEFKVGDVYQADFQLASYDMKVVSVSEYEDSATGKTMKTILFEPMDNMTGVSETDKLTMTINKPVISNVVYVDEKAVLEAEKDKYYVYTINEDGYRTAVEVTIGDTVDGYTIITSGLTAGEQVTIN
jgi:multidrug efflux pump subunit AcrA (membrane-fusion protein)